MSENASSKDGPRRTITIERSYSATVEAVWALWTTERGIESWWGPDGFSVTVKHLDLRVGGELVYTMTATAPDQVEFMKQAGMPTATDVSIVYTGPASNRCVASGTRAWRISSRATNPMKLRQPWLSIRGQMGCEWC
jgi:hypothetical protein